MFGCVCDVTVKLRRRLKGNTLSRIWTRSAAASHLTKFISALFLEALTTDTSRVESTQKQNAFYGEVHVRADVCVIPYEGNTTPPPTPLQP